MCIIIDANVAHEFAATPPHVDARPIVQWVNSKNGRVAIGGRLADELYNTAIKRWILELMRSGSAVLYPKTKIVSEQIRLNGTGLCVSDDVHVIALAFVSGARLLYTKDGPLKIDFKNTALLQPKGKIYSSHRNKKLLSDCPACRDP